MSVADRVRLGRARPLAVGLVLATAVLAGCATPIAGTATPVAGAAGPIIATTQSPGVESSGTEASSAQSSSAESSSTESSSAEAPSSGPASSETHGTGSSSAQTDPSSSSTAPGSSAVIDPAEFAAMTHASTAQVTSVTGAISVDSATATVKGTFKESLRAGKVTAIDMKMTVSISGQSLAVDMLIKDDKAYIGGAAIMGLLDAGNKKWALVSSTSSNVQLRTLAGQLDGYLDTASADQYTDFAKAATSIEDGGVQPLGPISAHRYEVTVDTAKAAQVLTGANRTSMRAALAAGVKTVPTTIWLDKKNRLVQANSTVTLQGVKSTTVFKVTDDDTEVTITAPAAADVYTG